MTQACQRCGKEFRTFPSRIKDGGGKFCSQTCSNRAHLWKGDKAQFWAGYGRARRLYPILGKCEVCKKAKAQDCHHIDKNQLNNDRSNIVLVCKKCHVKIERRWEKIWETRRRNMEARRGTA